MISIHALLAESDRQNPGKHYVAFRFLSTLSLRRATLSVMYHNNLALSFLSTLSLRRATRPGLTRYYPGRNFYPRSPCGERRSGCLLTMDTPYIFLSTLSLRRATPHSRRSRKQRHPFLSTLSLRRATLQLFLYYQDNTISIHALLAESDLKTPCVRLSIDVFLSTLSLRRATLRVVDGSKSSIISIHALLAESDCTTIITICIVSKFLSTLSLRRATDQGANNQPGQQISIHALLAESDYNIIKGKDKPTHFYPRSPCGERLFRYERCE